MIRSFMNVPDTAAAALARSLAAVKERAKRRTDICDHLETLFLEAIGVPSRLIVELGAGDGESTFVLERVAKLWKSVLVSVDIEDRREVSSYRGRIFVRQDDVAFAKEFADWCRQRRIEPDIDVLFIDTSHLFEHTVQEIDAWFPFLAPRCKVFLHDTNLKEVFVRRDGSEGRGWNNERGVIKALERFFLQSFGEEKDFAVVIGDWHVRHISRCNGLMILDRYGE